DWRPEIEPLVLVALLAMLALAGRRLPAALRWLAAGLILLAAVLQFADAAVLAIFDRQLDLYFDLPHAPSLIGLVWVAAGAWPTSAGGSDDLGCRAADGPRLHRLARHAWL